MIFFLRILQTILDPNREKDDVAAANTQNEFANTPSGGKFDEPWGQVC
jgi:hypothetical protein